MTISIDGLLGSAQRINSQRQYGDSSQKKKEVRPDSINIGVKVNSRLDSIETELREIQTALTKNQIIRAGIGQILEDRAVGGAGVQGIINSTVFNGSQVLKDYLAGDTSDAGFSEKLHRINEAISADTGKLKRLQIEVDNIMASDLAVRNRTDELLTSIDSVFSGSFSTSGISQLNPETVMKLIR